MADAIKLDGHHRVTLEKLFQHPVGHNIQWHDVLSLLEATATTVREHDGRYHVTLGSETETFEVPRGHDIGVQTVVDLRRMLKAAGISAPSA